MEYLIVYYMSVQILVRSVPYFLGHILGSVCLFSIEPSLTTDVISSEIS
jgi:hypothetical protein